MEDVNVYDAAISRKPSIPDIKSMLHKGGSKMAGTDDHQLISERQNPTKDLIAGESAKLGAVGMGLLGPDGDHDDDFAEPNLLDGDNLMNQEDFDSEHMESQRELLPRGEDGRPM